MPTFGFSAFLKLINLNERPRRTEIRKRLYPSGGGYDFHKKTRQLATGFLVEGRPLEECLEMAALITSPSERRSAVSALNALAMWRDAHPGRMVDVAERTYESPAGMFKVRFLPDFGVSMSGRVVAVHIWNSLTPRLQPRLVRAALALIAPLYGGVIDDLSVLSLRTGELISLGDPADSELTAGRLVDLIEDIFIDLRDDGDRPSGEAHPRL